MRKCNNSLPCSCPDAGVSWLMIVIDYECYFLFQLNYFKLIVFKANVYMCFINQFAPNDNLIIKLKFLINDNV